MIKEPMVMVEDIKNRKCTVEGRKRSVTYIIQTKQGEGSLKTISLSKGKTPEELQGFFTQFDRAFQAIQNYEEGLNPSTSAIVKDVKEKVAAEKQGVAA